MTEMNWFQKVFQKKLSDFLPNRHFGTAVTVLRRSEKGKFSKWTRSGHSVLEVREHIEPDRQDDLSLSL